MDGIPDEKHWKKKINSFEGRKGGYYDLENVAKIITNVGAGCYRGLQELRNSCCRYLWHFAMIAAVSG